MKWFFIIMIMQLKMTIDNALVTIQTNQKGDFVRHNQLMEAGLGMEWRKRQRKRQEKEKVTGRLIATQAVPSIWRQTLNMYITNTRQEANVVRVLL